MTTEGFALVREHRFTEAAALMDRVLADRPDMFEANYIRGLAAIGAGDRPRGVELIAKAEKIYPQIERFDLLAPVLRRQGRSELAILRRRFAEWQRFAATDAFVISYPKCGRTWLRFMLGNYALNGAEGDPLDVTAISRAGPDLTTLEISHDDYPHWKPYSEILSDKRAYQDKRVAFLARDPRDVVVSYYFQYTLRGDKNDASDPDYTGSLADFVRRDLGGLRSVIRFFNVWAENREVPEAFHLLTYEDLRRNTAEELRKLIAFIGWPARGPHAIAAAVEAGGFSHMRELEASDALHDHRLHASANGNPEGFKVRRGVVGGYRDYLGEADTAWMDALIDAELDDLFAVYKRGAAIARGRPGQDRGARGSGQGASR